MKDRFNGAEEREDKQFYGNKGVGERTRELMVNRNQKNKTNQFYGRRRDDESKID